MDLSTIKNTGNWGSSAANLNENFSKVGLEVDKLKYAAYNSKLYATEALLKQAVPSPKVGDWAIVGDSIPGEIYQCRTDGVWTATGQTGGGYGMEVTEKYVNEITEVHNEYTGDIVNNPDDEDLVSVEKPEGAQVLKLADKTYNASAFSGMGRAYLRKNMAASKNVLTQAMVGSANTRYIIQYDYDLNGQTITVPEDCTLDFQGGSVSGGTLVLSSTSIISDTQSFRSVTLQGSISNGSIDLRWFGAVLDSPDTDNHDAIMNAVRAAYKLRVPAVTFPSGVIYTTPLSFQEFGAKVGVAKSGGIKLTGSFSAMHKYRGVNEGTVLKCLPATSEQYALLQFCSEKNMKTGIEDEWSAINCAVENMIVDCDNNCLHGINGNMNLVISNVYVTKAISDGIVAEDYSYPFIVRNTHSTFNGGNGMKVQGPMTTVFTIENCEFDNNGQFGLWIESGAYSTVQNLICQANQSGGVKIIKDMTKYAGRPSLYFLTDIYFRNLYLEANGTLSSGDSNYEGNHGLYITANPPSDSTFDKPMNISVTGGSLTSGSGGKSVYVESVYGLTLDATYTSIYVNTTPHKCVAIRDVSVGTYVGVSNAAKAYMPTSYTGYAGDADRTPFLVQRGGFFQERGRTHKYFFSYDGISAGETKYMNTAMGEGGTQSGALRSFYILPYNATLKRLHLYKRMWSVAAGVEGSEQYESFRGTVTANVYMLATISGSPANQSPIASITLDHTERNFVSETFPWLVKKGSLTAGSEGFGSLVVELVASGDWNTGVYGSAKTSDSLIMCIVEVEEPEPINQAL